MDNESGNDYVPAEGDTPSDNVRTRNTALRQAYVQATADLVKAQQSGNSDDERAARAAIARIGNEFVERNRALVSAAAAFLHGQNREDHEAAALMGLWEAFVGTNPELVSAVEFDEDGNARALAGWNPEAGTFGTYSRRHVTGRAARSVASLDGKYQGMTYSTFQAIPAVRKAREQLRETLGHEPSDEQVAAKAEVTVATVQAVAAGTPASLSAPLDEDGSTLADLLSQRAVESDGNFLDADLRELFAQTPIVEVIVAGLRSGLIGIPALTVNEVAAEMGLGRGAVANAHKRTAAATRLTH